MKKFFTSWVFLTFILISNVFSQGTIKLTFIANYNSAYIAFDSILVENITQGGSLTLYYPDTILLLQNNVGVREYNENKNNFFISQNYPNPFEKETTIKLLLFEDQITIFNIFNFYGQKLAHYEYKLNQGIHLFTFHPGKEKNYLLSVTTNHGNSSIKLINTGFHIGSCDLAYNINNSVKAESKSLKSFFPFINGDQLKYTGFATPCNLIVGTGFVVHTPTVDDFILIDIIAPTQIPTLITIPADTITANTAITGGNIISDGCLPITQKGVCWGNTVNPIITGNHTQNGSGSGAFSSTITGLSANNIFYVRAYAINNHGTAYGNNVSFTTLPPTIPIITTTAISAITNNSAESGGVIVSDGGASIISRGVCWSTIHNPIVTGGHTTDGTGTGNFTSNIIGLTANTLYYIRAYATNSAGTAYGNELNFTTGTTSPTLTTSIVSNITDTTAISGGNITDDGGAIIISRGVCWSTVQNPVVTGSHTTNGSGIGSFTSSITGLSANIHYFIRAYATNSVGTSYGNEINFTSAIPNCGTVSDTDGNVYNTVIIGTQCWMRENLKTSKYRNGINIINVTDSAVWSPLRTGAWCYYMNDTIYNAIYGKLYNWYAASNSNGICPTGWHVPTTSMFSDEWGILATNLGNTNVGGKLKEAGTNHWAAPNTGATNETGFTSLPGGYRGYPCVFYEIGLGGYWWCATSYSILSAYSKSMTYNSNSLNGSSSIFQCGFSVRCLRD